MEDEYNGLEPSLSRHALQSGLEPSIKPQYIGLDGIGLTLLADIQAAEAPIVAPTPQAATIILGFGEDLIRYERVNLATGERLALALPPELVLIALDAAGRYYLLGDGGRALVRYTADLKEDLRIALRGQRNLSIGRDGYLYTWLFSSQEMEVYGPTGQLLRVLSHIWGPYSLAVDDKGIIWLGEAAMCHVVEIDPSSGETLSYVDPKEDFTAENLFCYTYAMSFDRSGNLWTFNGQGDVGATIISPGKTRYVRFASKDIGPEYQHSEPIPSPWNDEVYFVSEGNTVSLFQPILHDWKAIVSDINIQA